MLWGGRKKEKNKRKKRRRGMGKEEGCGDWIRKRGGVIIYKTA